MHESHHTHQSVMSHIWEFGTSHRPIINRNFSSCHTYGWVMSHIWMSHVTHMDESCQLKTCDELKRVTRLLHSLNLWHDSRVTNYLTRGLNILFSLFLARVRSSLSPFLLHVQTLKSDEFKPLVKEKHFTRRDVGGWGRDRRKQKDFRTTVKKRQKQKISWALLDVGVCYSFTGTRFPVLHVIKYHLMSAW